MNRIKSHFEKDEPFLENLLRYLRFHKIFKYLRGELNKKD